MAPWPFPHLVMGLPSRQAAMKLTPHVVFSVPWNSEPFIWPPASWKGRWERSTASGCNPSKLFLNAVSCEKSHTGEAFVIQMEHLPGLLSLTPSSPARPKPLLAQTLNHLDRPCPFLLGVGMGCSTLSTNFCSQSRPVFTLRSVNHAPPQLLLWTKTSAMLPALHIFLVSLWVLINHS